MNISIIILTKNSETLLPSAIKSVKDLEGEVLVLDGGSTDNTVKVAKSLGARVEKQEGKGYADWRNTGIKKAKGDWIFYLDFDEEATPEIKKEIKEVVEKEEYKVFAFPRKNIILGRAMMYGGWYPDYVERLFKKGALEKWVGDLHERPVYKGELGYFKNPIIHHKHDNLEEMVEKTNKWSEVEAKLMLDANHPKMSWWRFLRIMYTEKVYRLISLRGFQDGTEGVIYALYQMWSKFLSYAKLWEMQQSADKRGSKADLH